MTVWPTGESRPLVSTLNALTGTITANAAIVPSGQLGAISVYPSGATDLVIDIDGYFAPADSAPDPLSLHTLSPCRVLDTRQTTGTFSGTLPVSVLQSGCQVPSAQAYVLNATVVPLHGQPLGYLTLWPDAEDKPVVATLNALDGAITSNMAIVSTLNGFIDAYATSPTDLVVDIFSYFAPISPLNITTTSLPSATLNYSYNTTLGATGGVTPYTWSIASGSLPPGLNLDPASGFISGTPTMTGTYPFTVQVSDSQSPPATASTPLSITVNATLTQLNIVTTALPSGTQNQTYSAMLAATGGLTPYNWSVTTGSLPRGLSLNSSTGAITGTPSGEGISNFTARVTDSSSPPATASAQLSITITPAVPFRITTTSLPPGLVGVAYSAMLTAVGGVYPYTWAITAGSLPNGLHLNANTGAITGTPTTVGMPDFTVQITDSETPPVTATGRLSINISIGTGIFITSISPQPATAGDTIMISGQNFSAGLAAVFSDAIGGALPVPTVVTGANLATATVPQGSATGSFYVQITQFGLPPVQSNVLQFQRLARLRIRAPQNDVGAGESIDFQYALLGDSTPQTVLFTTDQGTFTGSTYFAPASISSDSFAHVTACISGTHSCDTQILGLHPFRIAPAVPLVAIGNMLQLSTVGVGGGVNWSLLTGGGSLQSSGLYTAGTTLQSGGPAIISASSSSTTEQTSVGVTGGFPGLVNRIHDYVDQHTQTLLGTYPVGLAVNGNRMFVAASNHQGLWNDSYFWIDVYDIADPLHPAWITAVESNSSGPVFALGAYLYSYTNTEFAVPGVLSSITLYSVETGVPVLRARTAIPQSWNISNNQGVLCQIPLNPPFNEMTEYDLTGGSIYTKALNITLPSDANSFAPDTAFAVGNRLFVSVAKNDGGAYILTYDLSTSPPTLMGMIDARSLGFYASGNLLFGELGGMEIYDISSQLPVLEGYVDGINAQELVGTQLLARTGQQGCEVVDVSNPQQPNVTSIVFDGVIAPGCGSGVFVGNYVYAEEEDGGITIFDNSQTGGPVPQASLYGGPHLSSAANDLLLESNTLYAATSTYDGPALEIYDVSTTPANRLGEYAIYGQQGGYAVQGSSHYAYFGMSGSIAVLDVSQPSSPTLVGTLPVSTISLARANNTLYAGTSNNTLVVMDITNPSQPAIVRTITLSDLAFKVRVYGNLLLVADNAAGLIIYDISSPQSPILLSQLQGFTLVADVAVQGTKAYIAADVDGLGIVDISNPSHPVLLSKNGLARIDPFYSGGLPNQALSVSVSNGVVYVGTLNGNGLVFGLDCSNLAVPRIVSVYAYGSFIETWTSALLFNGTELFVGGGLNAGVYPVTQANVLQPFDSINQYFPPAALQNPGRPMSRRASYGLPKNSPAPLVNKFHGYR